MIDVIKFRSFLEAMPKTLFRDYPAKDIEGYYYIANNGHQVPMGALSVILV